MAKKIDVNIDIFPKQAQALEILQNDTTVELCFGGSKGPGKSRLGIMWILINCLVKQPGCRYLIGRNELSELRKSTLNTFFQVCSDWKVKEGKHYNYNENKNKITFANGSEILLVDLKYQPSDPEYQSLGGIEVTGVFVDEASQIDEKCRYILKTLIRYKLEEFKVKPKLLYATNPIKNHWLFNDFYKPYKEGTLSKDKYFLPALPTDNPRLTPEYLEILRNLDPISKKRLYYGLWEYGDSTNLVDYDALYNLMTEQYIDVDEEKTEDENKEKTKKQIPEPEYRLSCDIARLGKDATVLILWQDLIVVDILTFNKQATDVTEREIIKLMDKYKIDPRNVVIDCDGIGGGVFDHLPSGIISFVNGSKALKNENYYNLKTQCYFKLADMINKGFIKFKYKFTDVTLKNRIASELENIIQDKVDNEGKICILNKKEIKRRLGFSPDYSDAMAMAMILEVKKRKGGDGNYMVYSSYLS